MPQQHGSPSLRSWPAGPKGEREGMKELEVGADSEEPVHVAEP